MRGSAENTELNSNTTSVYEYIRMSTGSVWRYIYNAFWVSRTQPAVSEEALPESNPIPPMSLQETITAKNWGLAHKLVDNGASTKIKDHNGKTPLHHCAKEGNLQTTKALIGLGFDLNAIDYNGSTPLHLAAQQGHANVVKILLQEGVSLNSKDNNGRTPLHLAVSLGHTEIARRLLRAGASTEALKKVKPIELMLQAILANDFDFLQALLETGIDINMVDNQSATLLHHVVKRRPQALSVNTPNIAKKLIELGANCKAKDDNGCTPLHYVTNPTDAEALLNAGAKIETKNDESATPLFLAARRHNLPVCQFLIEKGADPYWVNKNQKNIMHFVKETTNLVFLNELKKLICFSESFVNKTQAFLQALIKESLRQANLQGKKLLIVLGESHGEYRGYQIEKMVLNIANALNVSHLMVELSATTIGNEQSYMPLLYAKRHLHFTVVAADNNRCRPSGYSTRFDTSKEGMQFRNFGMTETLERTNQHAILITGAAHLHGVLEARTAKLKDEQFFIVPCNLTAIIGNSVGDNVEEQFMYNPKKVIQFGKDGFNLRQAQEVIKMCNHVEHFPLMVEVRAQPRVGPKR